MNSRDGNGGGREPRLDGEIERYQEAATGALEQLEWCADYLYRIRKPDIAKAVGRNRRRGYVGLSTGEVDEWRTLCRSGTRSCCWSASARTGIPA